jgi:CubicO group peptidase (beta-lactamase class C family)
VQSIEGLRGAAIVTRAGRVQLEAAGGLADAETGVKCTTQTRFQICSVSKQFAAVAAMLLAESGQLDLAAPVARWFPGGPPQWQRATLHHLLTHTAGVRHWGDAPGFDASQPVDLAERIALIQQAPLLAEPGARWHYSSPGYLLVGHIVAQASGQSYAGFVTEQILVPLGLSSTSADGSPADAAAARGYRDGQPVAPWPLSAMPGTGDICSTVGDLAHFTAAVRSGSLIRQQRFAQAMITAHAPFPDDQGTSEGWVIGDGYGNGQFIGRIAGHTAYFHPGDNPGFQSLAVWLPGQALCAVILTNDEAADTEALLRQLIPVALDNGELEITHRAKHQSPGPGAKRGGVFAGPYDLVPSEPPAGPPSSRHWPPRSCANRWCWRRESA